jgi:phosphoribosylanthranilate isomerase
MTDERDKRIRIKIGELSRLCDIALINEMKPEFIGFTFSKSAYRVTLEEAEILRKRLNPGIRAIGIFSNTSLWLIAEVLEQGIVDAAELDENVTVDDVLQLRRMTDKILIKKVLVQSREDIRNSQKFPVDFIMYTLLPGEKKSREFLKLILEYIEDIEPVKRKFFLSADIDIDESRELINRLKPYCINIKISFEERRRKTREELRKEIQKLRELI